MTANTFDYDYTHEHNCVPVYAFRDIQQARVYAAQYAVLALTVGVPDMAIKIRQQARDFLVVCISFPQYCELDTDLHSCLISGLGHDCPTCYECLRYGPAGVEELDERYGLAQGRAIQSLLTTNAFSVELIARRLELADDALKSLASDRKLLNVKVISDAEFNALCEQAFADLGKEAAA